MIVLTTGPASLARLMRRDEPSQHPVSRQTVSQVRDLQARPAANDSRPAN